MEGLGDNMDAQIHWTLSIVRREAGPTENLEQIRRPIGAGGGFCWHQGGQDGAHTCDVVCARWGARERISAPLGFPSMSWIQTVCTKLLILQPPFTLLGSSVSSVLGGQIDRSGCHLGTKFTFLPLE